MAFSTSLPEDVHFALRSVVGLINDKVFSFGTGLCYSDTIIFTNAAKITLLEN